MKTRIVSVFPACGKTHMYWNSKDYIVADSDSSKFSWIEVEGGAKERNPDFPNNYIEHIKSLIGEFDYIFVSSHEEVRKALEKEGLHYSLVLPDISLRNEWIGRCFVRGNDYKFMAVLCAKWDEWLNPVKIAQDFNHDAVCYLGQGEYLSDKMYFLDSIAPCN